MCSVNISHISMHVVHNMTLYFGKVIYIYSTTKKLPDQETVIEDLWCSQFTNILFLLRENLMLYMVGNATRKQDVSTKNSIVVKCPVFLKCFINIWLKFGDLYLRYRPCTGGPI